MDSSNVNNRTHLEVHIPRQGWVEVYDQILFICGTNLLENDMNEC